MTLQLRGGGGASGAADMHVLNVGESTIPRGTVGGVITCTSGFLSLAYFTARKTEAVTQVRLVSAAAAGATPTLVRVGVWTADPTGALLAQVAATPNDTALLAANSTSYTKGFSASFTKQQNTYYAVGILVVTTAAAPTVAGLAFTGSLSEVSQAPRMAGVRTGLTDLPATAPSTNLFDTRPPYFVLLP